MEASVGAGWEPGAGQVGTPEVGRAMRVWPRAPASVGSVAACIRDAELARQWLRASDGVQRGLALMAVGGVADEWAVEALVEATFFPEELVRAAAVEALERWWARAGAGAPPAWLVAVVCASLRDPCDVVRIAAVASVARLGGDDGARVLAERYPDECDDLQGEILGALAASGYNAVAARLFRRSHAGEARGTYTARVAQRLRREGKLPEMDL